MYYITKWALTQGIIEVLDSQAEIWDDEGKSVPCLSETGGAIMVLYPASDYFTSLPEAQARFEELRQAKIKSLEKQITKLQKLTPKLRGK